MAYGFIEVSGVVAATVAADIMCKAADVRLLTKEQKLGGRLVTIVIEGEVAAVKEAIDAACACGIKLPAAKGVLASPHPEVKRLITKSARKFSANKDSVTVTINQQQDNKEGSKQNAKKTKGGNKNGSIGND